MMQKLLRPENGYVIRTPEEVKKFVAFLMFHIGSSDCVVERNYCSLHRDDILNYRHLPYTIKNINPDYADLFITEAELAQAEAEHVSDTNVADIEQRVADLEAKIKRFSLMFNAQGLVD